MVHTKLKAATIHLSISASIAALVLMLVYLGWYRGVFSQTEGIGEILLIMLAVDVIMGPVLTFVVFKVGKKSLRFDLSIVAFLQLAFLAYGLYTVQVGRPAFVVFSKDRFESVSVVDWPESSKSALEKIGNPFAVRSLVGPSFVAVIPPADLKIRNELMFEAVRGGPDLQHRPEYYVALKGLFGEVIKKSLPLEDLKKFNPKAIDQIALLQAELSGKTKKIGFLPLKGKREDAAVLVNQIDGEILAIVLLKPWQ
jgi:hypothetical protein